MKFAFAAALFFAGFAAAEKVNVEVQCRGMDYGKLNPKALAYSAMALELSYNTISQAVDGQYIGDVHSNGPIIASFDEYLRGGQGGCTQCCGTKCDDMLAASEALGFTVTVGKGGCTGCPPPDHDDMLVGVALSKEWEAEYAALLSKSSFAAFHKVERCSIGTSGIIEEVGQGGCTNCQRDDDLLATNVVVDVTCRNVDFSELSIRDISYATHALQTSYNKVHMDIDGSALDAVMMDGPRLYYGTEMVGQSGGGCSHCQNDDFLSNTNMVFSALHLGQSGGGCGLCQNDDLLGNAAALASTKAWQDLFLSTLLNDPKGNFKHAANCKFEVHEAANFALEQ